MKRILLLLTLITQFAFSQTNTTTTTVGKLKMNIPDPGAKKDSVVVWDGTTKLLKFRPVSQITGTTNLDQLISPTGISVFSSTGTDIVLPLATATNAGLLAPGEKTKLAGIAAGATANQTDAYLLSRANHTGMQAIATVTGLQTDLDGKEPTITAGTTSQYYRGDKTFQTLDKTAVGLGNVDNTSDLLKPISTDTQTALNAKQDLSAKGVANGYAGLDASGKVPLTQINDALLGSVNYQGTYNAATNTPALPTVSTSNKGYYYVISTAGTQAGLSLNAGDWIISNGTAWGKIDNNNAVTAVNNATGNVILTTSNITEGSNLYYTDARVNANASVAASATARHNAVTIGTANGLSLSTQQLSMGLSSSTTTGALSSTHWTTFNNKFNTPAGLTTNYLPKWNGSGFENSQIFDNGTNAGIGTNTPSTKLNVKQVIDNFSNGISVTKSDNDTSIFLFNNGTKNIISSSYGTTGSYFPLVFQTSDSDRITITPSGRVLVNTTTDNGVDQVQVNGTITASPATAANQVVVKSQLDAVERPYKVYTAMLVQSGTDAPVATVLENTLGGTVVWTRNVTGNYYGTLNNAFPNQNKIAFFQGGTMSGVLPLEIIRVQYLNSNAFQIFTQQATDGALVDSSLANTSIEVRVYN